MDHPTLLCDYFKRITFNGVFYTVECNYEKPDTLKERIRKLIEQWINYDIAENYIDLTEEIMKEIEFENAKEYKRMKNLYGTTISIPCLEKFK